MLKKVAAVLFMFMVVSVLGFAQEAKDSRVEGKVVRSNKDKMTLTVRVRDTDAEKTVHYDANTKWEAAEHGKEGHAIDAGDVHDGDQVICVGSYGDKKEFTATTISKRLSHSPK
jgi:hypothetical protein